MPDTSNTKAMELKKYRRIAGLTQQQLADKAGVDATLISRLERGQRTKTRWSTIARLAQALNLEPHELEPILPPAERSA
jgi:transcriptional regulator with XRE-family HTH domain